MLLTGQPFSNRASGGIFPGPNTTLLVNLGFSDPSGTAISYTPLLTGSLGGLP
jgi:hypothetical protein